MGNAPDVLLFDGWTIGYLQNLKPLVPLLHQHGYTLKLFHFGGYGHDMRSCPIEDLDGALSVDIRKVRISIIDILKNYKPDVVIFLSTTNLFHQAVIRYCRYLSIPTLHIYHGAVSVQASDMSGRPVSFYDHYIKRLVTRGWPNVRHVIPAYINSLFKTRASLCEYPLILRSLAKVFLGRSYVGVASVDSRTDGATVYNYHDSCHAQARYGMHKSDVHIIGNPDLERFNLRMQDMGSWRPLGLKNILYIDTALDQASIVFDNESQIINFHYQLIQAFPDYRFFLKPHPATLNNTQLITELIGLGYDIVDNTSFVQSCLSASFVITEPSSAALVPAYLCCPLLYPRLSYFQSLRYGELITDYPFSFPLTKPSDAFILDHLRVSNSDFITYHKDSVEWVRENIQLSAGDDYYTSLLRVIMAYMCS